MKREESEMSKIEIGENGSILTVGDLKGEEGVREALPALVKIARELEKLKLMETEEAEPWKMQLGEIRSRFKELAEPWVEMDEQLRDMVLEEHEGAESVRVDGVGELVFPERWSFNITDHSKVERKYLEVSSVQVNAAIKSGARKIRGIEIYQKRGLTLRKEKI